jgi:hypothetical protein
MNDVKQAVRILRTNSPGPFNVLVEHIASLEKTADDTLVNAIAEETMRQNQGKTQILREILATLRS